jgi:glycerophosphoryl diester phosphodiesterase
MSPNGTGTAVVKVPRFAFLDHPGPLAFAHRGGGREKPENTLAAFAHAVGLGFRYVETDVRVTRDGVAVTFHDETLERTTDGRGRVASHSWDELRRVKVAGREPVARLDDLLGSWPDLRVNLDPKSAATVGPLAEAVRRTGAIDRVCIGSFSDARLRRLRRELGPRLCTSLGPLGVARLRLASLGMPGGGFTAGAAQVKSHHMGMPYVDRPLLKAARRHGLDVHVWTVDEPDHMESLLELGVDGLMSGRPSVLKAVLQRRGLWSGG